MGNFVNKEWSQQIDNNSGDDSLNDSNFVTNNKQKSGNILKRKLSNLINSAAIDQSIEYFKVDAIESPKFTPTTKKINEINFDPRSPSSGIVRYMNFLFKMVSI